MSQCKHIFKAKQTNFFRLRLKTIKSITEIQIVNSFYSVGLYVDYFYFGYHNVGVTRLVIFVE